MDPVRTEAELSDLVMSTAGRDQGSLFYCIGGDERYVMLVNGKDRTIEKPKRKKSKHTNKVLRSETRVAEKLRNGDKVLNSELRRDLAYLSREMQGTT